jgi:hypothetical protein
VVQPEVLALEVADNMDQPLEAVVVGLLAVEAQFEAEEELLPVVVQELEQVAEPMSY